MGKKIKKNKKIFIKDKQKFLISVLINCYNAEETIKKTILSALNQTYKKIELIIVDDASTDNTVNIIKSFRNNKISLFQNKKHLGLGSSRILAQKLIKGKYVAVLDADDVWEKNKIFEQYKILNKNKRIAFISTWFKIIDEKNKTVSYENKIASNKNIIDHICEKNIFAHSSIIYKKDLAKKYGWYSKNLEYSQDFDLIIKFLKKNDFFLIKKFLTKIRVSDLNMSSDKEYLYIRSKEKIILLKKIRKNFRLNFINKVKNLKSIIYEYIKLTLVYVFFGNKFKSIKLFFF